MDQDWLDAVLSEPEGTGMTWAVLRMNELIAGVETVLEPEKRLPAAITALATKPALRRQGIVTAVLQQLLLWHKGRGIAEHVAYISLDNVAGQPCVKKVGFAPVTSEPNERGYLEFRHRQ